MYFIINDKENIIKNKENYNLFLNEIKTDNKNKLYIQLLDEQNVINTYFINNKEILYCIVYDLFKIYFNDKIT